METRIVKRYKAPPYPTRDYLDEHPELLQWVPERWRRHPVVLAALSMAIPLMVARPSEAKGATDAAATPSRVAPLFIHGDGRGSFGCVAINPPVFLSEDEARQVIQDEAKKAGINFAADARTLKDVNVPTTSQFDFLDEEETGSRTAKKEKRPASHKQALVLDGYDAQHDVAYEYVSPKDFAEWEAKDRGLYCSVSSYDFRRTAEVLTNGLAHTKGKTVLAVFYEPAASAPETGFPKGNATERDWTAYREAHDQGAKALGAQELRAQVRDFLEWLKAQGVI